MLACPAKCKNDMFGCMQQPLSLALHMQIPPSGLAPAVRRNRPFLGVQAREMQGVTGHGNQGRFYLGFFGYNS